MQKVLASACMQTDFDHARREFLPEHPEQIVTTLLAARPLMAGIKDPLVERKLKQLDETIALCSGLSLDAATDRYSISPGGSFKVNLSVLARLPVPVTLHGIDLTGVEAPPSLGVATAVLTENQPNRYSATVRVPDDQPYSQPYWLVEPPDGWLYRVPDPREIGDPENPPVLESHFHLKLSGSNLDLTRAAAYRYVDPLLGETVRPLAIVPPVAVNFNGSALIFPGSNARRIEIPLTANTAHVAGEVHLEAPHDWRVEPASQPFDLAAANQQATAAFDVTPASPDSQGELRAVATVGDRKIGLATEVISYSHIPAQTLFPPAERKFVRADIQNTAKNIGYVAGAGDEVPAALRQIGAQVSELSAGDLSTGDLSRFDAIVTGVRAFNTRADLRANVQRLFDYVQNGGAMVVQYNVLEGGPFSSDASLLEHIGPFPITISRDRVTDPNAPVAFPSPANPLLRAPNPITEKDFAGWVQERGLNFASEWDPKYESVLESHDPGEEPHPGGELYLRYGKGVYIFSAYSWFRELPAGVPGAYRLFANMVSAAKN